MQVLSAIFFALGMIILENTQILNYEAKNYLKNLFTGVFAESVYIPSGSEFSRKTRLDSGSRMLNMILFKPTGEIR